MFVFSLTVSGLMATGYLWNTCPGVLLPTASWRVSVGVGLVQFFPDTGGWAQSLIHAIEVFCH